MTRPTTRPRPAARVRLERLEPRDVPATFTWTGGDAGTDNWSDGDNWGGTAPTGVPTDDLVFPAGAARLANTNDIVGGAFGSIRFSGSGYTLSGEALSLGGGGGTGSLTADAGTSNNTVALAVTLAQAGGQSVEVGTGAAVVLSGAISGAGGALTKTGAGTLTLAGTAANTYDGATTVSAGTLLLNKSGAVAVPVGGLVVAGTGFVQYQQGDQVADAAPVRVTNGRTLDLNGQSDTVGTLTFGSATGSDAAFLSTGAGVLRLTGNVVREVSATPSPDGALFTGRLDLNGATRTVTVADSTADVELFIEGVIEGAGAGLVKAGAGRLQFGGAAANTYAGTTTVLGGVLDLNKSAAAVAVPGPLVVGDGTTAATAIAFQNDAVADGAPVTVNAGAVFDMGNRADAVGPVTVTGGGVNLGGTGSLAVGGPLALQAAAVTGGTLVLGGNVTVTAGAATTITGGIDLAGATRTFDVADGPAAADLRIDGVIQGAGAGLTKAGAGTLVLQGANSYTGATTVSAGVLRVLNAQPGSAVALTGGTLAGSGTLGPVAATGGTLRPALGAPTPTVSLFTSGLTLGAGSTFAPQLSDAAGGTADAVTVTGPVDVTGAALAPVVAGAPPSAARSYLLVANDGADPVTGTFAGLPQGATVTLSGVAFTIKYNGNDGNDIVLEPAATSPPPLPPVTPGPVRPVAAGGAADGTVRLVTPAGQNQTVTPFGTTASATRTAAADVDGDGVADVIAVTGPGTPIRVAVVSGATGALLVAPFDPFGGDFTGGGYVAAGDLDRDGRAEFAVTPDEGGGPRVTLFARSPDGGIAVRANFFGIDDANFRGGARAAVGDVNGDGRPDVVVAAGFGGGPRTAIFGGPSVLAGTPTRLVNDFFAFPGTDAVNLRNGAFVAAGDVTGDGFADLIFGGGPGGAPRVFVLSGAVVSTGNVAGAQAAPVANFFVANDAADRGGARVAVTNSDGDARADVAVGTGPGRPGRVRLYLGKDFTTGGEPATFQDIAPFGTAVLTDGVFVG